MSDTQFSNPGSPSDIEMGSMSPSDTRESLADALHRTHDVTAGSRVFRGHSVFRDDLFGRQGSSRHARRTVNRSANDHGDTEMNSLLDLHDEPESRAGRSGSVFDTIRRATAEDAVGAGARINLDNVSPPSHAEPTYASNQQHSGGGGKNSEKIKLVNDHTDPRRRSDADESLARTNTEKRNRLLGSTPEMDAMCKDNPIQNGVRFWKRVIFVIFLLGEFAFIPDPYDVGAAMPGTNHTCVTTTKITLSNHIEQTVECPTYAGYITEPFNFTQGKPYCGWENNWFLESGHLRHMEPALCMRNWLSYGFLCVSHSMGVVLYISLSVVMVTRMRFTLSLMQTTPICEWVPFHAMQEIHNQAGYTTLYALCTHACFHFLRYFSNGDWPMFYSAASISGYVGFIIMFLIVGSMVKTWPTKLLGVNCLFSLKRYNKWEVKYVAHMGWVLFAVIMWYHRTRFGVYWTVMLVLMLADRLLERCLMTTHVEGMELLPCGECGTMIRFPYRRKHGVAPDVEVAGSIVRISVPTLSVSQYHPFSAMYDPYDPRFACVYIAKAGDWTNELHAYAKVHRSLPTAWVAGPLYSEFQSAMQFSDIVLCCTGAAITPVLGLAQYFDPTATRVTLIWVTRDAELISYLMPVVNPATKIIVYFTAKKNAQEQIHKLRRQKFFAAPTLNARQKLKVEDGGMGSGAANNSGFVSSSEALTIQYGRPRNWDALIDEHVPTHDRAHTCVAISTRIKRLAAEVQGLCQKKGITNIRSDASFD